MPIIFEKRVKQTQKTAADYLPTAVRLQLLNSFYSATTGRTGKPHIRKVAPLLVRVLLK